MPTPITSPRLSSFLPLAQEHLWAGSKDEERTVARAQRLLAVYDPTLAEYSPLAAKAALEELGKGSTYNRYRSSLSSLLRAALLDGACGAMGVLPPLAPEGRPRDRVLSSEEQVRLDEAIAEQGPDGYALDLLMAVLVETGMRLAECWEALITEDGELYLEDSKNGEQALIPISRNLRFDLAGHPERFSEWVTMHAGLTISEALQLPSIRSVSRHWNRVVAQAGVAPITLHGLRHTAITRWAAKGIDLPTLSALARHTSTSTTLRYIHPSTASLKEAMDA